MVALRSRARIIVSPVISRDRTVVELAVVALALDEEEEETEKTTSEKEENVGSFEHLACCHYSVGKSGHTTLLLPLQAQSAINLKRLNG